MQQKLARMKYLIIDEMSMVGRKMFGQVDKRLRQVFPHKADELLGGCSCLLFGDFGQLPPVIDFPLYTTMSRTQLAETPAQLHDITPFESALYLHPTIEAVVEHNVLKLHSIGQPIATIKAVHTGPNANKASPDDAAGLEFKP